MVDVDRVHPTPNRPSFSFSIGGNRIFCLHKFKEGFRFFLNYYLQVLFFTTADLEPLPSNKVKRPFDIKRLN